MNRKAVRRGKWDEAIANWRRIVVEISRHRRGGSLAQFSIAETLEYEARQAGGGPGRISQGDRRPRHAPRPLQAIARLTATSMTVATERVFRSDETPQLKLVTRNVESVTVRAYKVDLETYFRKMHLGPRRRGARHRADRSRQDLRVQGAQLRQAPASRRAAIEVPLPGGARRGVMAVTVSSKTLEATTLVIQSDLDVIVKSSRDEVFVFAENMRTGKPWPGVRLLISNGQQVFAEGDDRRRRRVAEVVQGTEGRRRRAGVRRGRGQRGLERGRACKASASPEGLSDKGYIYTDRPAYRAGQIVHVRGCLRHAADDAYTVEKGKKFTLEVFDTRNRLLWQETVKLSEFGSFHAHFVLPAASPAGPIPRARSTTTPGRTITGDFPGPRVSPGAGAADDRHAATASIIAAKRSRGRSARRSTTVRRWPAAKSATNWPTTASTRPRPTRKGEVHFKLPTRRVQRNASCCRSGLRCPSETWPRRSTSCLRRKGSRSA